MTGFGLHPHFVLITIGLSADSFVTLDLLLVSGICKPMPKVSSMRPAGGKA